MNLLTSSPLLLPSASWVTKSLKDVLSKKSGSGNLQSAWKGIKRMSSVFQNDKKDINKINIEGIEDVALPNALNNFYCRLEKHDFSNELSFLIDGTSHDPRIVISEDSVRDLLRMNAEAP